METKRIERVNISNDVGELTLTIDKVFQ